MKKIRSLALCLTLVGLLAACGDRGSGFSPAKNAVTANPEDRIDLRARDYELPPATPAPDGPTASYDTGDSSGGRTLTLDTLNPALERAAAATAPYLADALAENALEDGRSTTIADETSEGDAAEATGGDLNVVTDPTETPTDTVVDPATGGEVEVEGSVEEVGVGEVGVGETATEEVETADETSDVLNEITATTLEAEDENVAEQAADSPSAASIVAEAETGGAEGETALEATGGTVATEAVATEAVATEAVAVEEVVVEAETGGATAEAAGSVTDETVAQPTSEVLAQADSFDWVALGNQTYANCVACHQQNGEGIVGAFPPLAGHINELYNAEGGRKYIINTVLYGLQGEIQVLGQTYNGLMSPWGQLSNEEIAATLNHELTSWGNDALLEDFAPIQPEEVEAERANKLSAAQVLELRPDLP